MTNLRSFSSAGCHLTEPKGQLQFNKPTNIAGDFCHKKPIQTAAALFRNGLFKLNKQKGVKRIWRFQDHQQNSHSIARLSFGFVMFLVSKYICSHLVYPMNIHDTCLPQSQMNLSMLIGTITQCSAIFPYSKFRVSKYAQ